jgi:hypothetical protein
MPIQFASDEEREDFYQRQMRVIRPYVDEFMEDFRAGKVDENYRFSEREHAQPKPPTHEK